MHEFDAVLERPEGVGTWVYVRIPFNVMEAFGQRGQVKVRGTVGGVPFRNSLRPEGDGTHYMVVNSNLREAAGVALGDTVHIALEPDLEPRVVEIPGDLQKALSACGPAERTFQRLSYSVQKRHVEWVAGAGKAETRAGRISRLVETLAAGGDK